MRRALLGTLKTANWWGVLHVTVQNGDAVFVDVAGENPVGGSSSLTYVMKEVRGRILKLSSEVEDFMLGQPGYRDSHVSRDPSLAVPRGKDDIYVGYGHMYVFDSNEAAAAAAEGLRTTFKGKAYIRDWAIHI